MLVGPKTSRSILLLQIVNFSKPVENWSFADYLESTHDNVNKRSLKGVKIILQEYCNGLEQAPRSASAEDKREVGRLREEAKALKAENFVAQKVKRDQSLTMPITCTVAAVLWVAFPVMGQSKRQNVEKGSAFSLQSLQFQMIKFLRVWGTDRVEYGRPCGERVLSDGTIINRIEAARGRWERLYKALKRKT
ncbi:hypothetical protein BJV82DRAFT_121287 [Fennellomyces sp. T-0311]|nr:hypothetical protein BJV82DRAFT_121287 [Fennellomyces sp. T-0311]